MTSDNHDEFDYSGYLIFNRVFEINTDSADVDWKNMHSADEKLLQELGEFEQAYRGSNKGVKQLDIRNLIRDEESIEGELEDVADSLIGYRFCYEKLVDEKGYAGNDELTDVEIPVVNDADIYWTYPDYMFIRGSETDVKEAVDYTTSIMRNPSGGTPEFEGVAFDEYFLLWVFWHYFRDERPSDNHDFDVEGLTDASITGDDDNWGGSNVVGDASELRHSPPLLQAILKDKSLSGLEGNFQVKGYALLAEIQKGKVHVKVAQEINRSNDTRRITLSVLFLHELVDLYNYWDGLDAKEKYPPYSFFEDLHTASSRLGADLDRISPELREDIRVKRGESKSEWDL